MSKAASYCYLAAAAILCLSAVSCSKDGVRTGGVRVGFTVGGQRADIVETRSSITDDGLSVRWEDTDSISLWVTNSSGSLYLSNQIFSIIGNGGQGALFASTLASPMPEDTYEYTAVCPVPSSVNGTRITFTVPAAQDGRAGGGADIMLSQKTEHGPLTMPSTTHEDYSGLWMTMDRHLTHILNFYLPVGSNGLLVEGEGLAKGEPLKRIDIRMPGAACGTLSLDVLEPQNVTYTPSGDGTLSLRMEKTVGPSTAEKTNYAGASILPTAVFGASDSLSVKLYSDNFIGFIDNIPLEGREFKAGHATPVKLNVRECIRKKIHFVLRSNKVGEDVLMIRAEAGSNFSSTIGNVYSTGSSGGIDVGTEYVVKCGSEAFENLAGTTLALTCQTKHAIYHSTCALPANLDDSTDYTVYFDMPALLEEDFSALASFSSDDEYLEGIAAGSKDAYAFLPGWTAARAGGSAGKCFRLAARHEAAVFTSNPYPARADSKPVLEILEPAKIKVSFDYSMGEQHLNSAHAQTVKVGYVTSEKAFKSGDTDGTFNHSFTVDETTGTYDNVNHHADIIIENVPAGKTNRISWITSVNGSGALANNNTDWLYIDNVVVTIAE
ncbi:MAG: fimbrillin family protein [Bacteroidales bacterium]|nr:fimbrillin family protein [Bacteroidales bacterium]